MLLLMRILRALPMTWRRIVLRRLDRFKSLDSALAGLGIVQYRHAGLTISVNLSDQLGREMIKNGFTERPFLKLVKRYAAHHPGCLIDIGANLGNYALALAPHFNHTIAFEANPGVFAQLQTNSSVNPQLNITPIATGLSDRDTELDFYPNDAGNSGASGFEKKRDGKEAVRLKVERGDNFASLFEPAVAAIKIDVEGHELEVLHGLSATIERDRPIIFMEWLTDTMSGKGGFEALRASLPGYRIYVPCARTKRHPLGKTNAPRHRLTELRELEPPYRGKYNLIFCFPKEECPPRVNLKQSRVSRFSSRRGA